MNSSDALFQLIKSLDKNEKRYFRLFSSLQGGDKKYMLVFNAIEKQKTYNEQKIISMFVKEKFVNRFPVTKQYLYELILSSLESYHHSTIKSMVQSYLHRIAILHEKGLYKQCEKNIVKAKRLALKYEMHLPLLELQTWEIKLMFSQSLVGITEDTITNTFNDIFKTTAQFININEYYCQTSLLLSVGSKIGFVRNQAEYKALQRIIDKPLFHAEVEHLPFRSQFHFYQAHGVYFLVQNDFKKAYPYYKKLADLMETHPHQITENQLLYVNVMDNLSRCLIESGEYREAASVIEKLSNIQVHAKITRRLINFITDYMKSHLCIRTGTFKEGLHLLQSIKGKWDEADQVMLDKRRLFYFQYNAAYIYFVTKNYTMANRYLNMILSNEIDTGSDIYCFAQIMSLIIHFELGNQELLGYKVKSTYRFLHKRKRLYKMEKIILDFLKKELPKINTSKHLLKSFEILRKRIITIITDPFERKALSYFDFISWLESKIENRPFAEVVREKVGT